MQTNAHHHVSDITRYVAYKVTALRTERGWSQMAVGAAIDKSGNQIGQIERGQVATSITSLHSVVKAFGITMSEFFKDFEGEKSS